LEKEFIALSLTTTRRTVLAAALAAPFGLRRVRAHQLGKLEDDAVLARIPALPGDPARWPTVILTWADIAGYCEATGIEKPGPFADETKRSWFEISGRLPLNDNLMFLYMDKPWQELTGFGPWQVDEVAVAFDPPDVLRVYRGAFDPERVTAQFTTGWGYDAVSVGEFSVLDSPSDDLDLTSELDRIAISSLKHLAVSDAFIVASRSREVRDQALDVLAGTADSLAAMPAFADAGAAIEGRHGFILMNGSLLGPGYANRPELDLPGTLPAARLFLGHISIRADGQLISLIADLSDPDAAEAAVPIVQERIETVVSPVSRYLYAEELAGYEVATVPGTGLVRVIVPNDEFAERWMRQIHAADLSFLATE
jgi:hypothetical protein